MVGSIVPVKTTEITIVYGLDAYSKLNQAVQAGKGMLNTNYSCVKHALLPKLPKV